jgi:hypothetical protein
VKSCYVSCGGQCKSSVTDLNRSAAFSGWAWTRTHGLCRDSLGVFVFSATYILSGAAKSLQGITSTRLMWVRLWVKLGHRIVVDPVLRKTRLMVDEISPYAF